MDLPKYTSQNKQERIGVHKIAVILEELGFIFRETSNGDVGVDGQIEYVNENSEATGIIAAVQIKSGKSYLCENKTDKDNWIFYADDKHKTYWEQYPIPVILLVYNSDNNQIYFLDVRYYLKANGLNCIKISKTNILNLENRDRIFEHTGYQKDSFFDIEELFNVMIVSRCKSEYFNISYLDLFLLGLTNLTRQLFFDMSIVMDIAECRSPQVAGGSDEYMFIYEYVKFVTAQNIAEINFGDCLIDWEENKLVPRFLAPLTNRGQMLLEYVKKIEANYPTIMPESQLVQERLIELVFDKYSYNRIEKLRKIQEQYITLPQKK